MGEEEGELAVGPEEGFDGGGGWGDEVVVPDGEDDGVAIG